MSFAQNLREAQGLHMVLLESGGQDRSALQLSQKAAKAALEQIPNLQRLTEPQQFMVKRLLVTYPDPVDRQAHQEQLEWLDAALELLRKVPA